MNKENKNFIVDPENSNELKNAVNKKISKKSVSLTCPRCSRDFLLDGKTHSCPHCGFIFSVHDN